MKPKRMMVIKASSLEAVNRSCTLVAALTLMQLTNVREATGDNRRDVKVRCCSGRRLRREGVRQTALTKTQAGDELGSAVGDDAVGVERFQQVGGKHQRHHVLR